MDAKHIPQTVEELKAEIVSVKTVTTPCHGSEIPWKHFPEQFRDGITQISGIRCGCGKVFEGKSYKAPTNQPAPALWAAFQDFKEHYESLA